MEKAIFLQALERNLEIATDRPHQLASRIQAFLLEMMTWDLLITVFRRSKRKKNNVYLAVYEYTIEIQFQKKRSEVKENKNKSQNNLEVSVYISD